MSSNRTSKRPSRAKQPWEKMRAINRVELGESKAAVARAMDVPESTLRGWCKNKPKIEALVKQPSSSPTSVASTETSEGREKRLKLDDSIAQNLSGRNLTPSPSDVEANCPRAMDLSRTSPIVSNSRSDNGLAMNTELSDFYKTARLFHIMQHAQSMNFLSGNSRGSLLTTAPRQSLNGGPNLPNDRLPAEESVRQWLNASNPSQVSPNSSSATLSTPLNGQQTTSPIAGNTPEQQNLYVEMYKAMMSTVGLPAPFNIPMTAANIPLLYDPRMQQNIIERLSSSYPISPPQSAKGIVVSEKVCEKSVVLDINSNDQLQNSLLSAQARPNSSFNNQYPSTSRQSASPSTNGQSAIPSTSDPSSFPSSARLSSTSTSDPSIFPSTSGFPSVTGTSVPDVSRNIMRDQLAPTNMDTSSTLDLSKGTKVIKSESPLAENDQAGIELEPATVVAKPPAKDESVPEPLTSAPRTRRSLAKVVNKLLKTSTEKKTNIDIHDCIQMAERLLEGLQQNCEHPGVTAFQLRQIETLITTIKSAEKGIASKRSE